jgi:Fungal N-terminal domain of STAND proteins
MAEFVSAIIGLVAVGAQVGNTFYGLIDTFKDAPEEFLDLSNEVQEFRKVVSRLEEARNSKEFADDGLDVLLQQCTKTLQQVDRLGQKLLKKKDKGNGETQVERIKWLASTNRAKKLREVLRWQKASLCNIIMIEILFVLLQLPSAECL